MLMTGMTLPLEMLQAAAAIQRAETPQTAKLQVLYQASQAGLIPTQSGLTLLAEPLAPPPDRAWIILPALWRNPHKLLRQEHRLVLWLSDLLAERPDITVAAVGTGVCLLAETQALTGQSATTHWHYLPAFAKRYPSVSLKPQHFMTQAAGPLGQRLYSTAGINSTAELTAFLIRETAGVAIATRVERHFFHEVRQLKTEQHLSPESTGDELVALALAELNRPEPPSIQALAARLGTSVRTLNRRFQQALQLSPGQYVQRQRLNRALELLKTSNLSVNDISNQAGFNDPEQFRTQIKKYLRLTPKQYRNTVRGKLFT